MFNSSVPAGAHVSQIVDALVITHVWQALGGPAPKHNRARAFYREGDNEQSVSLNDSKGTYYDFRDSTGGGVLALIQRVKDCNKAEALRWAADLAGVPLDAPLSPEQKREYARKAKAAEAEARELVGWKQ